MRRVHNQKIILPSTQESDSTEKRSVKQNIYVTQSLSKKASFVVREMLPSLVVLAVLFSYDAGLFSGIRSVFAKEVTSQTTLDAINYSPQNTPLLTASLNPDSQAIGGGDIFYEDGALISTGPIGEDEITAAKEQNGEISVYVVREGDALSQIAEMYGAKRPG